MTSNFHREALSFLVGLWLISNAVAVGQQPGVEARVSSSARIDVAPGRVLSVGVVVVNNTGETADFEERLEMPPGCVRIAPLDAPFRLEDGEQCVRIVVARVAPVMSAGDFEIVYTASVREQPGLSGSARIAGRVAVVSQLELWVEPRPERVIAGDVYLIKVLASNRGNTPLDARLELRSSLGFETEADSARFALAAGETREIVCSARSSASFDRRAHHAVTFDLSALSDAGETLFASQASVAEIIPRVSGATDQMHRLPMQLRNIAIVQSGREPQFQTELSGFGSLDEAGERHIDFLFRGPGVEGASFFGAREQYGASYSDDHWEFSLGDRVYALSPLTEKRSFGRGASVAWSGETISAGGFYMATRYRTRNVDEWGAFLRKAFSEGFSMQANFLRKSAAGPLSTQIRPQNLVTIESQHRIGENHALRLEAGAGSRVASGGGHRAYRIDARGKLPGQLSYAVERTRAGPNFHGYYNDTETTFASLAMPLGERLRAHGSINRHAGNLALNDERSAIVNRENSWRAGATFAQSEITEYWFEWQRIERADILEPVAYDFSEDAGRLGIGRKLGSVYARSYVDFGELDNAVTNERGSFRRYGSSIHWLPGAGQSYSLFGSYGPSAYTGSSDATLSAGVSARWQLSEKLSAQLSYTRNTYDGLIGRELDQGLGSLSYEFENKSSISLVSRWSSMRLDTAELSPKGAAAVLITYTMPFHAPVARKRSIGALRGRVYDATRHAPGEGLERAIVQVGDQYAVTDAAGRFEFPSLKPGPHQLKVLEDSLSPQMAMTSALPLEVEVRAAATGEVDLAAAPAGSISVRVKRYAFADGSAVETSGALREECGEEGVAVEISNGRETWRAQTDRAGRVSFDRLPGGQWELRIASDALPPLHAIEEPARVVALQPGESRRVEARVLPQRRALIIVDGGEIRSEPNAD